MEFNPSMLMMECFVSRTVACQSYWWNHFVSGYI